MSKRLLVIRMSSEARDAIDHEDTEVVFWAHPTNATTNRRTAVTFNTPTGKYWAVGPSTARGYRYGRAVVGVERREKDKRWCWILDSP